MILSTCSIVATGITLKSADHTLPTSPTYKIIMLTNTSFKAVATFRTGCTSTGYKNQNNENEKEILSLVFLAYECKSNGECLV